MRDQTFTLWLLGSLLVASSMVLGQSNLEKDTLALSVEGLIPKTGILKAALFQSFDGVPGNTKKAFSITRATVTVDSETMTFENIPFGSYAFSVYQALTNDQRLNESVLGIPREPVGCPNDPPLRRGPPHFKDAVFQFNDLRNTLIVHMRTQ